MILQQSIAPKNGNASQQLTRRNVKGVGDELAKDKCVQKALYGVLNQRRRIEMATMSYGILEAIHEVGDTRSHQSVQR